MFVCRGLSKFRSKWFMIKQDISLLESTIKSGSSRVFMGVKLGLVPIHVWLFYFMCGRVMGSLSANISDVFLSCRIWKSEYPDLLIPQWGIWFPLVNLVNEVMKWDIGMETCTLIILLIALWDYIVVKLILDMRSKLAVITPIENDNYFLV